MARKKRSRPLSRCRYCGRALRRASSIADGFGAACGRRHGQLSGERLTRAERYLVLRGQRRLLGVDF